MLRLFVALALPELAADALSQLQSGLRGARWRAEESLHLTLQFIGETDRRGLEDVHSALAVLSEPAFDLTLSGCGFFGDRRPRALWCGTAPSPPLVHLQSKVATALQRAGHGGEKRKFAPHVTLAYLDGVAPEAAAAFSASHSLFSFGPFPVDEFHLYESHLGGEAAHYEILATYPLSRSR
ncbi:MAG: RNA 2',3'-cyclic phosphodiesterase [Parvularculaceae bacterium]|nr:RNA 2',3'-cyclic phosphodiesterase [Parvularculaceae bacterium]